MKNYGGVDMDKSETLSNIVTLAFYYQQYRYQGADFENCISAIYVNDDVPIEEMEKNLKEYFVDISWDIEGLWKKLNLVQKDFLLRSINGYRKITDVKVHPEYRLISLKYQYLCSLEKLYQAHDLLISNDYSKYEVLFPELSAKNLEKEIDHIELILHSLTNIYEIQYAEESEESED